MRRSPYGIVSYRYQIRSDWFTPSALQSIVATCCLLVRGVPTIPITFSVIMATAMRSDFMAGTALQSSTAAPKPSTKKFQVSAIFKKAQKQVKGAQESAKANLPGNATQAVKQGKGAAKKASPSPPSGKKAQQAPKQAANKVGSIFSGGSSKKAQKAPKQAASKANSLFGGAKKQANKQTSKASSKAGANFGGAKKQASKASKKAGTSPSGKGWFGEERSSGLDKWYGTYTPEPLAASQYREACLVKTDTHAFCRTFSRTVPAPWSFGRG